MDCRASFRTMATRVSSSGNCTSATRPEVKLNDEAREFCWVTLAQALEMPINQPTRTLLLAVAEKVKGVKSVQRVN